MPRKVLGVDVAVAAWSSIGSATIEFDDTSGKFLDVSPGAISWPDGKMSPRSLADAIDRFARANGVCAVALDGPQGWRHPDTPLGEPGVGRRCEYACRTQGKTGIYPRTYPGNQRSWMDFSVQVFDELLARPGVQLADSRDWKLSGAYGVLECFPTSSWRSSGLTPLPAKSKRPAFLPYISALRAAYSLPPFTTKSHDDLQAVVAALAAAGASGGPVEASAHGQSSSMVRTGVISHRVEGLIWNVAPRPDKRAGSTAAPVIVPLESQDEFKPNAAVYVTQKVLDLTARIGESQMQIASSIALGGTRRHRVRVSIQTEDDQFKLLAGDTHVIWRTHQDPDTIDAFDRLFGVLADQSGTLWHVGLEIAGARPSEAHLRKPQRPAHAPPPQSVQAPVEHDTAVMHAVEHRQADFDAASLQLEDALARPNELSIAVPVAMLLQSWNAVYYSGARAFDASHFSRIDGMLAALRPQLDSFRLRQLSDLQPADRASVTQLFTSLAGIVGASGAAIVMHLWAPEFFPEWEESVSDESDVAQAASRYWSFMESTAG